MPTVAEILRQSGLDDEQIKAIDQKVIGAFDGVIQNANQSLEQAQLAQRANEQLFSTQIAPALDQWGNEKTNLEAQLAFYRTQNEAARANGFVPMEAPGFQTAAQPREGNGQFTANGNAVPGSPQMVEQYEQRLGSALGTLADMQWQYQKLFGEVMPDSPTKLAAEASAQRMSLPDYAAKKYDFAGKQRAAEEAKSKAHDESIRKEAFAQKDREYAEKFGSNPNVRAGEPSRFSQVSRETREGTRPDPLKLTPEGRMQAAREAIKRELSEKATVQ